MADTNETNSKNRRFYWLKLPEEFFAQKEIKRLRRIAGGDTYTVIYLKMLLRSLKDNGRLYFEGYESDFASEVALDIDEDVENVKVTIQFLLANKLIVACSDDEYELIAAKEMTGKETDVARRMRRLRNTENKMLPAQEQEHHNPHNVRDCAQMCVESETDIDKEKEKRESQTKSQSQNAPSLEDAREYINERINENEEGWLLDSLKETDKFMDYYSSIGWIVNGYPVRDWKALARNWVRRAFEHIEHNDKDKNEEINPALKAKWD